jgi:hypothetical protein
MQRALGEILSPAGVRLNLSPPSDRYVEIRTVAG